MDKKILKIVITIILVLFIGFFWLIYNLLPSDNQIKNFIGDNANLFGFLAFFGFTGITVVNIFSDKITNWIVNKYPRIFKEAFVEIKFDKFIEELKEFQNKKKSFLLENKTEEELESKIKEALTDKYIAWH